MAEIDSGLGWSVVDGAFFVDTAGQIGYQTMAWATGMTSWGTIQTCLQFVQQK